MGYPNRRYRVKDGKLEKRWDGTDDPEWFVQKADAWAAVPGSAPVPVSVPEPAAPPEAPEAEPPATDAPEAPEAPAATDYENWKMPQLREELKARTGKGPRPGTMKKTVVDKLRELDAGPTPWAPA